MGDYEKLRKLYDEIDDLIAKQVTTSSPEFITWHKKLERFLANQYGDQSKEYKDFIGRLFNPIIVIPGRTSTRDYIAACKHHLEVTKAELSAYIEEMEEKKEEKKMKFKENLDFSKVFIVHGHDEGLKYKIARLIENQEIKPIILHEQPNQGATIIEKFEKNSDVGAAICLFIADDTGKAKTEQQENTRARQNVVFEAGFFMGRLGRDHVIIIAERGVELPSDMQGIVYTDSKSMELEVLTELDSMGYTIDLNKLKRG
ncbi:nucleotide-binding protein [bacterium]|nr:nucleotide-binding protein [bacterium]